MKISITIFELLGTQTSPCIPTGFDSRAGYSTDVSRPVGPTAMRVTTAFVF